MMVCKKYRKLYRGEKMINRENFTELKVVLEEITKQMRFVCVENRIKHTVILAESYVTEALWADTDLDKLGESILNIVKALLNYILLKTKEKFVLKSLHEEVEMALILIETWEAGPIMFL
jgi:hypothetical protein